jgi:hypothetical protein
VVVKAILLTMVLLLVLVVMAVVTMQIMVLLWVVEIAILLTMVLLLLMVVMVLLLDLAIVLLVVVLAMVSPVVHTPEMKQGMALAVQVPGTALLVDMIKVEEDLDTAKVVKKISGVMIMKLMLLLNGVDRISENLRFLSKLGGLVPDIIFKHV